MFAVSLISWYKKNYRKLPWRNTNEPYIIWVSEIILQQTRVDQGLPYFKNFIERFPSLASLAKSTEEEVLNQWQGLGTIQGLRKTCIIPQNIYLPILMEFSQMNTMN